jgi:hypothetical protein
MKGAKKTSSADPSKNREKTGTTELNDRALTTRANKHPNKTGGSPPKLYLAGHHLGECPPWIRARLPEIDSWLGKTKFDKDGLRRIKQPDLSRAEWNFSGISEPREAHDVHEYEYLRECEIAYNYRADYLRPSRSQKAWLCERAEFVKKWPAAPCFALEPGLLADFFPLPYLLIPADVRAKMRADWKPPSIPGPGISPDIGVTYCPTPLVEQMDLRSFLDRGAFDGFTPLLGSPTYHCLQIRWGIQGTDKIEEELLEWFRSIRPNGWEPKRGPQAHTRVEYGLAQLSAWRARRAGLSQADHSKLLSKAGIIEYGSVRSYGGTTAFRKAAIAAQKRIAGLQSTLTAKVG